MLEDAGDALRVLQREIARQHRQVRFEPVLVRRARALEDRRVAAGRAGGQELQGAVGLDHGQRLAGVGGQQRQALRAGQLEPLRRQAREHALGRVEGRAGLRSASEGEERGALEQRAAGVGQALLGVGAGEARGAAQRARGGERRLEVRALHQDQPGAARHELGVAQAQAEQRLQELDRARQVAQGQRAGDEALAGQHREALDLGIGVARPEHERGAVGARAAALGQLRQALTVGGDQLGQHVVGELDLAGEGVLDGAHELLAGPRLGGQAARGQAPLRGGERAHQARQGRRRELVVDARQPGDGLHRAGAVIP